MNFLFLTVVPAQIQIESDLLAGHSIAVSIETARIATVARTQGRRASITGGGAMG
jgi:hypothetical protein